MNDEIVFFVASWEVPDAETSSERWIGGPCDAMNSRSFLEVAEVMFSSYILRTDWTVMYCDVPCQDSHQAGLPTPGRERGEQRAEEIENLKVKNSMDFVLLVDLMA